jgi:hypothetical protein
MAVDLPGGGVVVEDVENPGISRVEEDLIPITGP